MSYGKSMRLLVIALFACLGIAGWCTAAHAIELAVIARFAPEEGLIADAAMIGDGRLALVYPTQGRIADYSLSGLLNQHITREGGEETRFTPTTCSSGVANTLAVFDEASSALFTIAPDGNIIKGVTLAYPTSSNSATALSRIGNLAVDSQGNIWAMLPDRGILAQFSSSGEFIGERDLRVALDDKLAMPSRFQINGDGSLSFLDYHQGAVFKQVNNSGFRRISLKPNGDFDAAPSVQDYAMDNEGNVLIATYDEEHPLVLLVPQNGAMVAHPVSVDFPSGAKRLACRYSGGKYIVWSREESFLVVIELR